MIFGKNNKCSPIQIEKSPRDGKISISLIATKTQKNLNEPWTGTISQTKIYQTVANGTN